MAHAGSPSSMTSSPQCSICLEAVLDNHGRSTARLHCGHVFHLDCIGSSFNFRGQMQCPNCRTTENGEWLHATRRSQQQQSINEGDENPVNQIEVSPPATRWWPFAGVLETLPSVGESVFILPADPVAGDVFIVSSDSLPDPNLVLPLNGHQGINDLQLQQQSEASQSPRSITDNTRTLAIHASSSSELLGVAGMVSYGGLSQGPLVPTNDNGIDVPGHDDMSSAGNQGSLGISSGTLVLSSNVPSLTTFQVASEQPPVNWPSPSVLASMLTRTVGLMNPPSLYEQVGDLNMAPRSEIFIGNASDAELLLSGPENDGTQLGPTFENMPPEYETGGHGFTMFQFL